MLLKSPPHVRAWWEGYWERYTIDASTPFKREPTWVDFVDSLKEEFFPIKNYDDQYMRWMTLCKKRDHTVLEYTDIFHAFHSTLDIKNSEQHLVWRGRFKQRWISWKSPHWKLLINMQSKLRRNSSNEVSMSLGLQIHHNRSMEKEILMKDKARRVNLKRISPTC
jgi:hypothetical protein